MKGIASLFYGRRHRRESHGITKKKLHCTVCTRLCRILTPYELFIAPGESTGLEDSTIIITGTNRREQTREQNPSKMTALCLRQKKQKNIKLKRDRKKSSPGTVQVCQIQIEKKILQVKGQK